MNIFLHKYYRDKISWTIQSKTHIKFKKDIEII